MTIFSPIAGKMAGLVMSVMLTLHAAPLQAQNIGTVDCVIASNDGRNGFRTDEISNCRINTRTGDISFVFKDRARSRSYDAVEPLTTRHLEAAAYWGARAGRFRFTPITNPAGFDPQAFLNAAAQATHGFVLVRNKKNGGRALNVVYITDGVYRSIDFDGTNLRDMPEGLLTTR